MTTVSILDVVVNPLRKEYADAGQLDKLESNEEFRLALMFANMGVAMQPADARSLVRKIRENM